VLTCSRSRFSFLYRDTLHPFPLPCLLPHARSCFLQPSVFVSHANFGTVSSLYSWPRYSMNWITRYSMNWINGLDPIRVRRYVRANDAAESRPMCMLRRRVHAALAEGPKRLHAVQRVRRAVAEVRRGLFELQLHPAEARV
jgi:hypothetical protein